jgi:energy-coupling factor transport system ATP-binding protein
MPIKIENLTHIYMKDSVFEHKALDNVSLEIQDGEFIGLIGHTGSGKSTLIQHLNGLLKPTGGRIIIDDLTLDSKVAAKAVRRKVGLVFQYPEHQLFEETVYKDVAFGPKNLGISEEESSKKVREAMHMVGLDYEKIKDISPFDLSGGQKRRVAIAGVLAMGPKILILDEPTAGLDPKGRDEILREIQKLHMEQHITVILVSHRMEEIAEMADRIIVMSKGQVVLMDTPAKIFNEIETLERIGLGVPQITYLTRALKQKGFDIEAAMSVKEAEAMLLKALRG